MRGGGEGRVGRGGKCEESVRRGEKCEEGSVRRGGECEERRGV